MISIGNHNKIMSDRNIFNQIVYTPLSEALRLLEERQKDPKLVAKVKKLLDGDIPKPLKNIDKYGVQFRQIATPNNEAEHFLKVANGFGLMPIFMEYHQDKFSSNNCYKRSLGQLNIQGKCNKNDEFIVEKIGIMDFNKHNGKKLDEVVTHWNEPIIDFHRRLFNISNLKDQKYSFFDTSEWIKKHGTKPEDYYKQFLLLFVCHGILFENFLIEGKDANFSRDIVLPAIESVINLTGIKPLIIPIGPLDMDNDNYWFYYHSDIRSGINK
jgi:hypothetical protein